MKTDFQDIAPDQIYLYKNGLFNLIDSADVQISNIKPSAWCEQNRIMTPDVSPIPGPFSYENSPYSKEIVDCLSPDHPARIVAVMKGAQIGFSTGVIEAGIGWIISQNPGNILFLVGHEDLVKDSMKKVDRMIDNSGIRSFIRSTSNRARNTKSGDTDNMKEYPDGYLKLGISNHKTLRNISMQYGFIDDFEGMKGSTKEAGATQKMIEQRFAAFAKKMKLFYISTPELKQTSNIEPVFELGDKRKYNIKCPCCDEFIPLEWEVQSEINGNEMVGMTWETTPDGKLIAESVGYTCQKCGGFFDDSNKTELIQSGKWIPTAVPSKPGYYSYHISALYAPIYMFGWEHYVRDFMECNPLNGKRDEEKFKTFKNLVLGETYEPTGKSISANQLQKNIREYEIDTIPEKMSITDGNGKIIMLTAGSDLNGKEDDARLDWEIIAHSESGATYSINHGSVGTFIPKDKNPDEREHFSYRHGVPNSVWPIFEKILSDGYINDNTGKSMRVFITGLDSGYMTNYSYTFIGNTNLRVVALKGKDYDKFLKYDADLKTFKASKERRDLYLVESNHTKDILNNHMNLTWVKELNTVQPYGFMNFPTPSDGKYLFGNFFSHFEAEHKIVDKSGNYRWLKKTNQHQNHLYDCRLYGIVARDIMLELIFREYKIKNGTWRDYVAIIEKSIK